MPTLTESKFSSVAKELNVNEMCVLAAVTISQLQFKLLS